MHLYPCHVVLGEVTVVLLDMDALWQGTTDRIFARVQPLWVGVGVVIIAAAPLRYALLPERTNRWLTYFNIGGGVITCIAWRWGKLARASRALGDLPSIGNAIVAGSLQELIHCSDVQPPSGAAADDGVHLAGDEAAPPPPQSLVWLTRQPWDDGQLARACGCRVQRIHCGGTQWETALNAALRRITDTDTTLGARWNLRRLRNLRSRSKAERVFWQLLRALFPGMLTTGSYMVANAAHIGVSSAALLAFVGVTPASLYQAYAANARALRESIQTAADQLPMGFGGVVRALFVMKEVADVANAGGGVEQLGPSVRASVGRAMSKVALAVEMPVLHTLRAFVGVSMLQAVVTLLARPAPLPELAAWRAEPLLLVVQAQVGEDAALLRGIVAALQKLQVPVLLIHSVQERLLEEGPTAAAVDAPLRTTAVERALAAFYADWPCIDPVEFDRVALQSPGRESFSGHAARTWLCNAVCGERSATAATGSALHGSVHQRLDHLAVLQGDDASKLARFAAVHQIGTKASDASAAYRVSCVVLVDLHDLCANGDTDLADERALLRALYFPRRQACLDILGASADVAVETLMHADRITWVLNRADALSDDASAVGGVLNLLRRFVARPPRGCAQDRVVIAVRSERSAGTVDTLLRRAREAGAMWADVATTPYPYSGPDPASRQGVGFEPLLRADTQPLADGMYMIVTDTPTPLAVASRSGGMRVEACNFGDPAQQFVLQVDLARSTDRITRSTTCGLAGADTTTRVKVLTCAGDPPGTVIVLDANFDKSWIGTRADGPLRFAKQALERATRFRFIRVDAVLAPRLCVGAQYGLVLQQDPAKLLARTPAAGVASRPRPPAGVPHDTFAAVLWENYGRLGGDLWSFAATGADGSEQLVSCSAEESMVLALEPKKERRDPALQRQQFRVTRRAAEGPANSVAWHRVVCVADDAALRTEASPIAHA